MKKALIIGCGNIGALYDFDNSKISNHARALLESNSFALSVYDSDSQSAEKASQMYSCDVVNQISESLLDNFDWISLCTPTVTHFHYLEMLKRLSPKLILCEKPVASDQEQLATLKTAFQNSHHTVFVNYFRRFQPFYRKLKTEQGELLSFEDLRSCRIEYCRGFMNSASHAFDLLEFLFERPIELTDVTISKREYDVFAEDPTLSLSASWEGVELNVIGRSSDTAPLFNIYLKSSSCEIRLTDSGNEIQIIKTKSEGFEQIHWNDCLRDYMKYSVSHVVNALENGESPNFLSSISLNSRMLRLIN